VTNPLFARNLLRKSKRALRSARLDLQDGDFDSAVNRSYYAMFDMARASLLSSGVPEDKLPRTHKGVIAAFRQHAIASGKISVELAGALSRTELLRLQADYSGTEIDAGSATDTVARAETFVQTVERVFSGDDNVSEPSVSTESAVRCVDPQPLSLEEERRQARENWARLRQRQIEGEKEGEKSAGHGAREDQGHLLDTDSSE
jgi:uncharacterized protein (UPF0332 family)